MDQTAQPMKRGSYTANLLGNIRSHLAGLQSYDVMALELIQNADDAKADKIVFDITHDQGHPTLKIRDDSALYSPGFHFLLAFARRVS